MNSHSLDPRGSERPIQATEAVASYRLEQLRPEMVRLALLLGTTNDSTKFRAAARKLVAESEGTPD